MSQINFTHQTQFGAPQTENQTQPISLIITKFTFEGTSWQDWITNMI